MTPHRPRLPLPLSAFSALRALTFTLATLSALALHLTASANTAAPDAAASSTTADLMILLVYVVGALAISFACSIAEAVLLSISAAFIEGQRAKDPSLAATLTKLKQDNLDQSLAAILTLNTIAHTVGAIMSGSKATEVFGDAWFGVFSAVMTLAILFLSEIVPKTIGAVHWTKLVRPSALFVRGIVFALYPLVWVSERLTKLLSHGQEVHIFSRDEFAAMARVAEQSGQVKNAESRVIQNLLRFDEIDLFDVMTPRTVLCALHEDTTLSDALTFTIQRPFSRLLTYAANIDNVTGFVLRDDILLANARPSPHQDPHTATVKSLHRKLCTVPDTTTPSKLLESLIKERQHIALVVNEYGGTEGVVTLEDLLETLMGVEIVDEKDKVADMRALARKLWAERAKSYGITIPSSDPPAATSAAVKAPEGSSASP